MSTNKKMALLAMILFCGCSPQLSMVSSNGSDAGFDNAATVANGTLKEKRVFTKGEECMYRVETEKPLQVGFDVDLSSEMVSSLQNRYEVSGVFEDTYAGEVNQINGGSGLGSLHGGYIEMTPTDGWLEFTFKNHLDTDFEFEVYAKPKTH